MARKSDERNYALEGEAAGTEAAAPELAYRPKHPEGFRPGIALIGCGGISEAHLKAYRAAGFNVVALCDLVEERARKRQKEFFPQADVETDYRRVLDRKDVEVVDVATHPEDRVPILRDAIRARKHVLSQKPFVTDLDLGEELVALAEREGVKLAVNQNGRWAPHFSYIREAVRAGVIGEMMSVHTGVHWDHTWTVGTPFEEIEDLVLYDFGIHWFDFLASLLGSRMALKVHAVKARAAGQTAKPPMLAEALVELEGGQASLVFDAHVRYGPLDHTYVGGSRGSLYSVGPNLGEQTLTLTTKEGRATPKLEGSWFPDGFRGTMGELLCAIQENREPLNGARANLRSLALCFAAIAAANDGAPKRPGAVRRLPERP